MLQLIFEKLINMNITVNIGHTAYQGNPDCPSEKTNAAIQYEGHEEH